jgi:hypothetical protein
LKIGPLNIAFQLPEPDACKTLSGSACPLESGDLAIYRLLFNWPTLLPVVSSYQNKEAQHFIFKQLHFENAVLP